jgi:hypothetical protein
MLPDSLSDVCQSLVLCIAILAAVAPGALCQQSTGSIKGSVTDQQASLVVDAAVFAKDANGIERKTSTNSAGIYEFKGLPSGYYDLRVVAPGFKVSETKNVAVTSGKTTTLDLELSLAPVEQTVTVDDKAASTDADKNGDAVVLRGRDLEALPNDPDALAAALQAMAGPNTGDSPPQVTVDGFSNGKIPPKAAIREVRINQNPYSAQNEYPGWGGIEIYTQPGSEKFHGSADFNFNDERLNSRNPFTLVRAPFQQRAFELGLSGPIVPKRASFSVYWNRYASDTNSVVNATILDPSTLKPTLFNQTFVTPQISTYLSGRGDLMINKRHTLVGSYEYNKSTQDLQGIGGFSLPSRAFSGDRVSHTLRLTETAVLNEKTINETRFQFSHSISRQIESSTAPSLNVLDSFFAGGAQVGNASNQQDRMELQNFTSWQVGKHFLKIGGRVRYVRVKSVSPGNFGGTYTFGGGTGPALAANDQIVPGGGTVEISSLEEYRRTLVFERQGLSAAQIRLLGGGATQFSIAGGSPSAIVSQTDISFYVQDDWKLRPNFTVSPGLRYENQTNVTSNANFAPRMAFAWSPSFGHKKPPPPAASPAATPKDGAQAKPTSPNPPPKAAAPRPSKTVIRGGFGIFYNRVSEDLILQAERFNGLNQQQFVVSDPAVLDLFPAVPPIGLLSGFAQPQTRRLLGDIVPSLAIRSSLTFERQLPHKTKLSVTYFHNNSRRNLRTVNINAPLAGTYDPNVPTSGVRPLGQGAGNILEYQSNGHSSVDTLAVNFNGRIKTVSFWSGYNVNKIRSTDGGTSGSSFDPYDFTNEWATYGRQFFYAGGNYQARWGFSLNTFVIATSGQPFNITTGRDTNGDTFFTERPAFATDLSKPGVIVTPLGAFDPNPTPGEQIIPRNFGRAPGFLSVNLGLEKVIKFGRAIPPKEMAAPADGKVVTTASGQKPAAKQPIQRPYQLGLSIYAANVLNKTNSGTPVGNMSSPYFLQSTALSSSFFFGPGGGSGGNRQLTLRVRLSF